MVHKICIAPQGRKRESITDYLPVLARPPDDRDAVASWFHTDAFT